MTQAYIKPTNIPPNPQSLTDTFLIKRLENVIYISATNLTSKKYIYTAQEIGSIERLIVLTHIHFDKQQQNLN